MTAHKLVRTTDPDTSYEAAEAIVDGITELQGEVLAYAKMRGTRGFTDVEMCSHFQNNGSTYRTRRAELVAKGLIVDTGERLTLPSKRRAIIWMLEEDFFWKDRP